MKLLSKFTLIFMGIFLAMFAPLFAFTRLSAEAAAMNTRVNDVMVTAAYDAMQSVAVRNGEAFKAESQKRKALDTFYRSLSIGYFKPNIGENDPLLESFIPFVMLVDNDCIYICYNRDYNNWGTADLPYYMTPGYRYTENYFLGGVGGTQYTIDYTQSDLMTVYKNGRKIAEGNYYDVKAVLDEKDPGAYGALDFLSSYEKYKEEKAMVITSLAQRLINRYLNWDITGDEHESGYNRHGRQHIFTVPLGENEDWQRALTGPTIMAFYEGVQTDIYTDYIAQVAFSGGELVKETHYYVTREGGTSYYHLPDCPHLTAHPYAAYSSMEEAAEAGAYPCPDCIR